MAPAIDRTDVDPSVTDEEIERAIEGTPAPFVDAHDDEAAVRSLAVVPATLPQRIANARRLRDDHVNVGVGMCLAAVRGPILGLPPVYPSAEVAGEHSSPFHKGAGPRSDAPRASIGFAFNGRAGHVWLELGAVKVDGHDDALVSTTDFHENGFEGIALRSRMLPWCGASSWGWGESVNGFDVWPEPRQKPAAPKPWTWRDTVAQLERDLARAKANHVGDHKIEGLERWIARMKKNHQ